MFMINNLIANRPPGYELFFAPLEISLDPTVYEKIQFAYFMSKFGHRGQIRDDGSRYFDHPKATAWIYINELNGRDPQITIDSLLHDVPEDTYLLSFFRISWNFGEEIAKDLRAITKLPKGKETIEEYFQRVVARGPKLVLVKLCDRLHNLRCLASCSVDKIAKQLAETEVLMGTLLPVLEADSEFCSFASYLTSEMRLAMQKVSES